MMIQIVRRGGSAAWLFAILALAAGCGERPTASDTGVRRQPGRETPMARGPEAPVRPAADPPAAPVQLYDSAALQGLSDEDVAYPVREPEVLLSQQHQATCLVNVGDRFPELSLLTADGQPTPLSAHHGQRLTVVVFWDAQHPMAVEQISRLQEEVAQPYSAVGVQVVAINVGDSAEDQQNLLSQIEHSFVVLRDADRQAYAQIATGLLPRTYLLDAEGRVLWLDVEYSRSARRELRNAILYHLRQQIEAAEKGAAPVM